MGNRSVNITKLKALTSQVGELNQFLAERDVPSLIYRKRLIALKPPSNDLSAQSTLRKHANSNPHRRHLRHCSLIYSMKPKLAL